MKLFIILRNSVRYTMTKRDHEQIKALIKQKHEQGEIDIDDEEKKRLEVIAGQKWEDMWISKPDASRLMTEV